MSISLNLNLSIYTYRSVRLSLVRYTDFISLEHERQEIEKGI